MVKEYRGPTMGQLVVLVLLGACLWVVANMVLDNYRQARAEQAIQDVLTSPVALNASIDNTTEQIQTLCIAKGYTEAECKKILGN